MMTEIVDWLVQTVEHWGLIGIFVLMFIESSLFPFPSEVVMVPAGISAGAGNMDLGAAILAGTAGSLAGAYFNYYLAGWLGRPFLLRYGRYFFLPEAKFEYACAFFERHGAFGTFSCRLVPGIRQLVSIPAGLARFSHLKFSLSTTAGAGIWVSFLAVVGYWIGNNREAAESFIKSSLPFILGAVVLLIIGYVFVVKRQRARGMELAKEAALANGEAASSD